MIILDTNVLSELLKPVASSAVVSWLNSQPASTIFVTSITQAEILYGIAKLPSGKRRDQLSAAAQRMFSDQFQNRILVFDGRAAAHFASIGAERESVGRPISQFDTMIAAIARSHGFVVATRDTRDFELCGIKLINPWGFKSPG